MLIKITSCSAINCTNCSENKIDLSFPRVPTENNKVLQSKWLQKLKHPYSLPSKNSFFTCSDHSEEDYFERDLMAGNSFTYFV